MKREKPAKPFWDYIPCDFCGNLSDELHQTENTMELICDECLSEGKDQPMSLKSQNLELKNKLIDNARLVNQ